MADKNSPEKSGFDFFGEFVLTEGLGGEAGHHEMWNRPFSSDRQIRIRQKKPVFLLLAEPFWPRSWTPRNAERVLLFYISKIHLLCSFNVSCSIKVIRMIYLLLNKRRGVTEC
jgi:hypothetical protein